MARRRKTGSNTRGRKAAPSTRGRKRAPNLESNSAQSSETSIETNSTEKNVKSSPKLSRGTKVKRTAASSDHESLSLPSPHKKPCLISVNEPVGEVLSESTVRSSDADPLNLVSKSKAHEKDGKIKSTFSGVVKQEIEDECDLPEIKEEDASHNIPLSDGVIKHEVVDCGVDSLLEEEDQTTHEDSTVPKTELSTSFISEVQQYFNSVLPQDWFCKATGDGFNIMLLSRCKEKAIQRRVFFTFQGDIEVSVHRKLLPEPDVKRLLQNSTVPIPLSTDTYHTFVNQGVDVVRKLWCLEICKGADEVEFSHLWPQEKCGEVDTNPYGEVRFNNTFRSVNCKRLIDANRWKCTECVKLTTLLKKRDELKKLLDKKQQSSKLCEEKTIEAHKAKEQSSSIPVIAKNVPKEMEYRMNWDVVVTKEKLPEVSMTRAQNAPESFRPEMQNTPINLKTSVTNLPKEQGTSKPALLITEILPKVKPVNLVVMGKKIRSLIEKDGIAVDDELSRDLSDIIKDLKLSPVQQQFVQEQTELANLKKSFGMRWNSTLIRFALLKKSASSEKYTGTGMITLPSGRRLFNFSQVLFRMKEFQKASVDELLKRVSSKPYQDYYNLMLDEIDVSNNLVFQKSNGELIGFVKLSDVQTEMEKLEDYINLDKPITSKPVTCKILMFMIRGISNGIKEAIALFASDNVPKEMVYNMTWDLIGTLEQSGMKVISVVSNGFPRTKDFMCLHTPVARLESGLVYDTINSKAQGRLLYFLTDASYLLKAIRDCFEESGSGGNSLKVLTKNNQTIVWKTIVKLYLARKWHCPKLNVKNVFLNEYSRKKLSYAAEVISSAVGRDLASRFWSKTSETVTFILKVNDLFNCLHGTLIDDANPDDKLLIPYTNHDDTRFSKLLEFLDYLNDWKKEVNAISELSAEEKSHMFLGDELCNEIEASVRAFIDVSKFLLKNNTELINPEVFCLDPIGEYLEAGWFGFRHCNPVVSQVQIDIKKV